MKSQEEQERWPLTCGSVLSRAQAAPTACRSTGWREPPGLGHGGGALWQPSLTQQTAPGHLTPRSGEAAPCPPSSEFLLPGPKGQPTCKRAPPVPHPGHTCSGFLLPGSQDHSPNTASKTHSKQWPRPQSWLAPGPAPPPLLRAPQAPRVPGAGGVSADGATERSPAKLLAWRDFTQVMMST